jgi:predicted Zn-dependent protease
VNGWQNTNPTEVTLPAFVSEKFLERKDYKSAIAILEKTSASVPNNPAVLNNLAWAYHQVKDPRALATAERAVGLANNHPSILDTAGWIMVERGDTARGLALLKKASAAAPASQDIRYHLAAALVKSGDKNAAKTELNKIIKDGDKGSKYSADAIALLQTL